MFIVLRFLQKTQKKKHKTIKTKKQREPGQINMKESWQTFAPVPCF
jgi:hypothetical protein